MLLERFVQKVPGPAHRAALIAVYYCMRETDAAYALLALLFGLVGAAGTAIHGGYDLSNAINPPANVSAGLLDLPSQVDPPRVSAIPAPGGH